MDGRKFLFWMGCVVVAPFLGIDWSLAQAQATEETTSLNDLLAQQAGKVTPSERKAAAARMAVARQSKPGARVSALTAPSALALPPQPGGTPDYFGSANWAFSPPLRKFVDTLPGLTAAGTNNLGQYIPIAVADTNSYPGSDYYELALVEYREQLHSDLPPVVGAGKTDPNATGGAKLRGYVQEVNGVAVDPPQYLGPLIIAQKNRPVRIKFINRLPIGVGGDLFIPVDATIMGTGDGPIQIGVDPVSGRPIYEQYTDNRATIHLHGGRTPWISDGTPHQWITPAGENTPYLKGASVFKVPDMPDPGPGAMTFYYGNQQSARLLFYHDHASGITRLNVYVGEAAGYLIQDQTEQDMVVSGLLPAEQIPLIIQDKSFVDATPDPVTGQPEIWKTDPTWNWGTATPVNGIRQPVTGDLWYPHVYSPAQNPYDLGGVNAFGRWHYGPWFWPPTKNITFGPVSNVYYDPINAPWEPPEMPGVPHPSMPGESFLDTAMVNGTAFPTLTVDPKSYRFRILNAANDRFFNLQLYKASPILSGITVDNPGSGYTADPAVTITGGGGSGATAVATRVDPITGATTDFITGITLLTVGSGYSSVPMVVITGGGGSGASASAIVYSAPTEVGMAPASATAGFPASWPVDGRVAGVPDPATVGPAFIQIGAEGGFLPAPVVISNQPIAWNVNPTTFNFGNVTDHALLLGPAERADVIIDFSQYAGQTLILYNDAPAAFPALDPRYDYYTGAPDLSVEGGHSGPQAGFGPNTRTLMQIKVTTGAAALPFNLAALENAFKSTATTPGVFEASQDPIIAGQAPYNSAYNTNFPTTWPLWGYVRIQDTNMTLRTVAGATLTLPLQPKAMHDEMGAAFDMDYGRMSGKLGLEIPFVDPFQQNFVLQSYVDRPTEILTDSVTTGAPVAGDGTQIWKITHNGVDTHPIHFHLFDVQLINRVGWDGAIRLPDANELGWKETVRVSPLEDTIVALRPVAPKQPYGLPDSVRPLNPALPLGSPDGFSNVNPLTGQPLVPPVTNELFNFGWEYVWHCHILSHEEMDMMRPMVFNVGRQLPAAPVLGVTGTAPHHLSWTDGTPIGPDPANPANLGNPANEIGFRVERAIIVNGVVGVYSNIATALANATNYVDATAVGGVSYSYRVIAYNAAGNAASAPQTMGAPPPPSGLTAVLLGSPFLSQIDLTWTDNSINETGFRIERASVHCGITNAFSTIGTVGQNATNYLDSTVVTLGTYVYRVIAFNGFGDSASSNVTVPIVVAMNVALASNGSAISGNNGLNWGLLIDGVTTGYTAATGFGYTFWKGAANAPGSMTLDLKRLHAISSMKLLLWDLDNRFYRYKAEASGNGATWVMIADRTTGAWRSWQDICVNPIIQARYLRLTGIYNSSLNGNNNGFHAVEWQVYGAPLTPVILTSTNAVAIQEGGASTFQVKLDAAPINPMTVTVSRVSGGNTNIVVQLGASLMFNASNWNLNQTVTLQAGASAPGSSAVIRCSAPGLADKDVTATVLIAAPSNLRTLVATATYVILGWTDNSNINQGFYIERSVDGGVTWTRVGQTTVNSTRNTGLTAKTTYRYRVQAFNVFGVSGFSNLLTVTTL